MHGEYLKVHHPVRYKAKGYLSDYNVLFHIFNAMLFSKRILHDDILKADIIPFYIASKDES
jgi:hypothetical protein